MARFGQSRARSVECPLDGPIAQSVEQLAFKQWVAGSSPARLTISINNLGQRFDIERLPSSQTLQLKFWQNIPNETLQVIFC